MNKFVSEDYLYKNLVAKNLGSFCHAVTEIIAQAVKFLGMLQMATYYIICFGDHWGFQ